MTNLLEDKWFSEEFKKGLVKNRDKIKSKREKSVRKTKKNKKENFVKKANSLIPQNRKMDYNKFLNTRYWKFVSKRIKSFANNTCTVCKRTGKMQVHHTKYPVRFTEHLNMNLLQCICARCHAEEHGLLLPIAMGKEIEELDKAFFNAIF